MEQAQIEHAPIKFTYVYLTYVISLERREMVALLLMCSEYYVAISYLTFPRGAMDWSVVCDCDTYWTGHAQLLFE